MTPSSTPPNRARASPLPPPWPPCWPPACAQAQAPAAEPVATGPDIAMPGPRQASAAAAETPSESMVINLIRLLVKQGVITQDAADALKQQAEDEADQARLAAAQAPPAASCRRRPPARCACPTCR